MKEMMASLICWFNIAMFYLMFSVLMQLHSSTALDHTNYQDDTHVSLTKESTSILCASSSPSSGKDANAPHGVALGMESGVLPDGALTASSSYNEQSVGPQNARLNREISGGAWCPSKQVSDANSGHEWLQVNLTSLYVITAVATQGRFGNGMGVEFTEEYWLEYSRDNGVNWYKYRGADGNYVLPGNDDTYSVIENQLSLPLVGVHLIRIVPISQHTRTVCLRVELYGCPYKDGPIAYSMQDGFYGGRFGDLFDKTYDGVRDDNAFLSGGLGQLVDGIKGDDNYKVNKGYEWIGWRFQSKEIEDHVTINFEFADIRNFTLASFHCNNMFSKEMQVFSSAKIWFSLDGLKWSSIPEDFEYMPDQVMERARDVVIHLHHRIGKFIKFDLKLASKWLLMSEVRIDSRPVSRTFRIQDLVEIDSAIGNTRAASRGSSSGSQKSISPSAINNNRSFIRESFLLIAFSLLGIIITMSLVFYIYHVRKRKGKMTGVDYVTMSMKDVATTPLYCEPRDVNRSLSPFQNNGNNMSLSLNMNGNDPEYAVPDVIGGSPPSTTTFVPASSLVMNGNMNGNMNGSAVNHNSINITNNNHPHSQQHQRYYASTDVLLNATSHHNRNNNSTSTFSEFGPGSGPHNQVNQPTYHYASTPTCTPTPSLTLTNANHGKSNTLNNSKTYHHSGNEHDHDNDSNNYDIESESVNEPLSPAPIDPQIIPQTLPTIGDKDIELLKPQIGYSRFGDVALAQMDDNLVILKALQNEEYRAEFLSELSEKWRISSNCDRFAKLFGFINSPECVASMVIEHGDCDLRQFLRNSNPLKVGYSTLIYIASEIASAMHQLQSMGFVHRDLSARNCLIYTAKLVVKVTDSGAFMSEYKEDYYKEVLPIRWMAPESILKGRFTAKSDVYSFGVTLWEILTYCKVRPHSHLSDDALLKTVLNHTNGKAKNGVSSATYYRHPFESTNDQARLHQHQQLILPKPESCPKEIYDLMVECWGKNEKARPEFREICVFLQRKNLGFQKSQITQ